MTAVLNKIFDSLPLGSLAGVRSSKADPPGVQEKLLRQLLTRASDTQFGREFGFQEIGNASNVVRAYQRLVPLHEFEDLKPYFDRVRRGEADVTWPGTFTDFAVSSGTASSGKILPVSRETLEGNNRFGVGTAVNYSARSGNVSMWFGKMLSLPGRIEEDGEGSGRLIGEVSGLQSKYSPSFISRIYQVVPNEVLFMDNWDQKLDAVVERTLDEDVRVLVMVPTWALVLFEKLIDAHRSAHGSNASTVHDVWPNLSVFFSGGVALSSYRELLEQMIGGPVDFIESYGASEGFFAFQDDPRRRDMLLHLDNNVFYEFVPLDQVGTDDPERRTVADVETGVRYALYATTCSGLWSYAVGDVVRFTDLDPHRIVVAGRTSEMIDRYGEAVFGEEAREALEEACEAVGVRFTDYHIAPLEADRGRLPGHQWLIEFERAPTNLEGFAQLIDEYLQSVNRHYQIRREAKAFAGPTITPVPRGTFVGWLEASRPRVSAQTKVPRMSEEREIADRVLRFAAEKRE
ncbi:MAG: GH3 auxin-responsive promoter family protein [Rhodothermia bacterium]|nr:GH3 auxin-responsive promoter family protein [Rhodothermia bacterium]